MRVHRLKELGCTVHAFRIGCLMRGSTRGSGTGYARQKTKRLLLVDSDRKLTCCTTRDILLPQGF
jgi:hypothetical protein